MKKKEVAKMTDKEFFEHLFMEYIKEKTKPEDYFYNEDEDDDDSELDDFFDMVFHIGIVILLLLWIL